MAAIFVSAIFGGGQTSVSQSESERWKMLFLGHRNYNWVKAIMEKKLKKKAIFFLLLYIVISIEK